NNEVSQHEVKQAQIDSHVFEERDKQLSFHRAGGGGEQKYRGTEASEGLPEIFPACRQTATVTLGHLAIIIDPADCTKECSYDDDYPDITIAQNRPRQRADKDCCKSRRPAHGGRA